MPLSQPFVGVQQFKLLLSIGLKRNEILKPVTAQMLFKEIYSLNGVEGILVVDDDREFTLLIERMFQTNEIPMLMIWTSNK